MPEPRAAKLFKNGSSQAVRLPADFRFEGEEVYITRDEASGDVLLSTRPGARTWGDFFDLMQTIDVPTATPRDPRTMTNVPQTTALIIEQGK